MQGEGAVRLSRQGRFIQQGLDLYRKFGGNFVNEDEFCDAFGLNRAYWRRKRAQIPAFDAALTRIEKERDRQPVETTMAPAYARERWPKLDLWKGLFIERFRETADRAEGWEMVGRTWEEVKAALDADPEFKEAYETVERELDIRVEDQLRRDALAGKGTAAQHLLTARGSALGKGRKGPAERPAAGDYDSPQARDYYRDLFDRHHGALATRHFAHSPAVETEDTGSDATETARSELPAS